jgi:hypothetical protein
MRFLVAPLIVVLALYLWDTDYNNGRRGLENMGRSIRHSFGFLSRLVKFGPKMKPTKQQNDRRMVDCDLFCLFASVQMKLAFSQPHFKVTAVTAASTLRSLIDEC